MRLGAFIRASTRTIAVASTLCGLALALSAPAWAQATPQPAQPYPPAAQPAQPYPPAPPPGQPQAQEFSPNEIVDAGHRFFGGVSRGLATIVEKAVSQWGLPNGYVLGEEGGGAFVAVGH